MYIVSAATGHMYFMPRQIICLIHSEKVFNNGINSLYNDPFKQLAANTQ